MLKGDGDNLPGQASFQATLPCMSSACTSTTVRLNINEL